MVTTEFCINFLIFRLRLETADVIGHVMPECLVGTRAHDAATLMTVSTKWLSAPSLASACEMCLNAQISTFAQSSVEKTVALAS